MSCASGALAPEAYPIAVLSQNALDSGLGCASRQTVDLSHRGCVFPVTLSDRVEKRQIRFRASSGVGQAHDFEVSAFHQGRLQDPRQGVED